MDNLELRCSLNKLVEINGVQIYCVYCSLHKRVKINGVHIYCVLILSFIITHTSYDIYYNLAALITLHNTFELVM